MGGVKRVGGVEGTRAMGSFISILIHQTCQNKSTWV